MSAALPLSPPPLPSEVFAGEFARRNAPLAADLGVTMDQLAALTAQTATLSEAEQLGWISPEERRLYQGEATMADLRALGYSDEEAHVILDEQRQDRACASSS
jgi:hypothetical protein